jgi:hypothetical protein
MAAHSLPASMPPVGPRRGGVDDKGPRLACNSPIRSSTSAGSRGQTCPEATIVTHDKARKSAARRRMAETGEAYAAARRLMEPGQPWLEEEGADQKASAGESAVGAAQGTDSAPAPDDDGDGISRTDSDERDKHESLAKPRTKALTPEERFRREAAAAGMPRSEIRIRLAAHRAHAEAARSRDRAAEAEAQAVRAEEQAEIAQEEADQAQEWDEEEEARTAQEHADEMHRATDLAWDHADRAEEAAIEAEDQAQLAQERLEAALGRRAMPAPKPMVALPGHLPPLPAVPLLLALPGIAPKLPDVEPLEVPPPTPALPPVPEPRPLRLPPRALPPRGGQRRLPPGYPPAPGARR